ncbi:MAG: hypothetical protein ACRD36_12645 [Candidatus Acidiferrum sp.]
MARDPGASAALAEHPVLACALAMNTRAGHAFTKDAIKIAFALAEHSISDVADSGNAVASTNGIKSEDTALTGNVGDSHHRVVIRAITNYLWHFNLLTGY